MQALILIGSRDAGKTQTLGKTKREGLKRKLDHVRDGRLFSRRDKLIRIYISSCQEQIKFCHADEVVKCVEGKLEKAKKEGAALLILPFTVIVNRKDKLNIDCITKALEAIKSKGVRITLVYLRRADATHIDKVDEFVRTLKVKELKSEEKYDRQSSVLLEIVDGLLF